MANLPVEPISCGALLRYGETSLEIDFSDLPLKKIANLQRFAEDPFAATIYDWSVVQQVVADRVVALFNQDARPGAVCRIGTPVIIVDLEWGFVTDKIKPIVELFARYGIVLNIEPYSGIEAPYLVTD